MSRFAPVRRRCAHVKLSLQSGLPKGMTHSVGVARGDRSAVSYPLLRMPHRFIAILRCCKPPALLRKRRDVSSQVDLSSSLGVRAWLHSPILRAPCCAQLPRFVVALVHLPAAVGLACAAAEDRARLHQAQRSSCNHSRSSLDFLPVGLCASLSGQVPP